MADEAVIRILLQDSSSAGSTAAAAGTIGTGTTTGAGSAPDLRTRTLLERWRRYDDLARLEYKVELDIAKKQADNLNLRKSRHDDLARLAHKVELDVAKKEAETIQERAARYDDLARLAYKAEIEVAKKQKEAAQAAADALIKDAEAVFDPVFEAKKRRERELQRDETESEYQRMYGKPPEQKSIMDSVLEAAETFRGVLGGMGGGLIGAVLDFAAAMRKAQVNVQNNTVSGTQTPQVPTGTTGTPSTTINVPPTTGTAARGAAPPQAATGAARAGGNIPAPIPARAAPTPPSPPGGAVPPPAGAGAAGGAAGAAGGAMAALPIIAIAIAVASAINEAVIGAIKATVKTAGGLAEAAASSETDPSVPIGQMGEAISGFGKTVGMVNPMLGYMAIAVGEATQAFASLMRVIDKTADRYAEFSAPIAQAQAIAEIRQVMGDFRRSKEVGDEMAKYIAAQSELQQKFEDVKVKFLAKILPLVTAALQVLEAIMPAGKNIEGAIDTVATPLVSIASVITEMANLLRDQKQPEIKDPTEQLNDPMFLKTGVGNDADPGLVPRF